MTTLDTLYQDIKKQFQGAGLETPDLDARILISHHAGIDHADFIADKTRPISDAVVARIGEDVVRRAAGEPVSRILGEREFWGLSFKVTPDTLDPRPDTETLIEAVLGWVDRGGKRNEPLRVLDLGTGTGCILISLLSELPNASGIGVDFSPEAMKVASHNVERHGLSDRVSVVQGDWFDGLAEESFDLIVSNPPYIPNPDIENLSIEVQNHDPILSLSGGNDGLDAYKKIIFGLKNHLNHENRAFLEIGIGQLSDLSRLVDESNLCLCDSHPDIAGIPRVVEICRGDK